MLPQHHSRRPSSKSKGRSAFGLGVCFCLSLFLVAVVWELSVIFQAKQTPPILDSSALAEIEDRLRGEIMKSAKDQKAALEEHLAEEAAAASSSSNDNEATLALIENLKDQLSQSEASYENLKKLSLNENEKLINKMKSDIKIQENLVIEKTNEVLEYKGESERLAYEVKELREHLKKSESKVNELISEQSLQLVSQDIGNGGGGGRSGGHWYDKPGYGKLISPYNWQRPLPPLIEAWRNGKIDWHDLIPTHSSLWERYGESKDDKFNFMKLVMKEVAVTDYLTQYQDSGLAANYGHDYGPMRNYSSCNLVDDPCMIHGAVDCGLNSFCKWNPETWSCGTVPEEEAPRGCERGSPKKLEGSRFRTVSDAECTRFINERVFVEHVADDPAAMFYHWWRYFKEVHSRVRSAGGMDKLSHFLLERPPNTQFFHYFGLLSKFCWRRTSTIDSGTCFCEGSNGANVGGKQDVLGHMLSELNLEGPEQAPRRVRVGILSRRRKRFILNEHEMVELVLSMGYDVQVLPMEEMTLYEQIKALRSCTVLVGIHGSGLNNAILLPSDAVLVQLLPYKLNYKGAFQQVAHENGVSYIEWGLTDPSKSYFHWEFLGPRELANGKQAVLDRGSPKGGAEVYTFWINQDIIVPLDEFKEVIERAVQHTGQLNPSLYKKQMTSSS